jgi:23S rRNA (pseudouridine1915-N3)-methyltransferase
MFNVTVISVGKLKERYYQQAVGEYVKRLSGFCKLEMIELPEHRLPDAPSPAEIAAGLSREGQMIREKLPKGAWFCVLTPEGKKLSSEGFAAALAEVKNSGRSAACFLLGSSFGIAPEIKALADLRLSFSDMTFPHHLARVMLLEQLYRAESIQAGSRYHK